MTEQEKREKVIKGLEHELQNRGKCGHYCHDGIETVSCEYDKYGLCIQHWGNDALALLKTQQPRVMALEEVRLLGKDAVVWYERKGAFGQPCPRVVEYVFDNWITFTDGGNLSFSADGYGERWRLWTFCPTYDQMNEVKL